MTRPNPNESENNAAMRGDSRADHITVASERGYEGGPDYSVETNTLLGFTPPAFFDVTKVPTLNPRNPKADLGIPMSVHPAMVALRWVKEKLDADARRAKDPNSEGEIPLLDTPAKPVVAALGRALTEVYEGWADLLLASAGLNLTTSEDQLALGLAVQRVDERLKKSLAHAYNAALQTMTGIGAQLDRALVPDKKFDQTAAAEVRAHFKQGMSGMKGNRMDGDAANTLTFLMAKADKQTVHAVLSMPPYLSGMTSEQTEQLRSAALKRFAPELVRAQEEGTKLMAMFGDGEAAWRAFADKKLALLRQPRALAAQRIHNVK
jgi:hypothetical protein